MSEVSKNLGRQLTELETVSSTARERYQRQLQDILEERLSVPARILCLAAGIVSLLFGVGAGCVVFLDREAYNYWPNLMLGVVVTLSAMLIGAALVSVAIRGVYRRQREGRWAVASGLAMLATWGLFMLLAAQGVPESLRGIFLTLGLICLGTAAVVANRVSAARAQLALEKQLLQLEHRLAEIAEKLDTSSTRKRVHADMDGKPAN